MTGDLHDDIEAIHDRDSRDWHHIGRGRRWSQEHQDRHDLLALLDTRDATAAPATHPMIALAEDIEFAQACWRRWNTPGSVTDDTYLMRKARVDAITDHWRFPVDEHGYRRPVPAMISLELAATLRHLAQFYLPQSHDDAH